MLGYRLVWPKATVFEIVIIGSNPITPANFNVVPSVMAAQLSVKQLGRVRFPGPTQVYARVVEWYTQQT